MKKKESLTQKELLCEAAKTIHKQIEKLSKGRPIAESKARSELKKLRTRKKYNKEIESLKAQYSAICVAIETAE